MNHPTIAFQFSFYADGSSDTVSVNLSSGPIVYDLPPSTNSNALGSGFNITATAVKNLSIDNSLTVESSSILLGVLTVTFSGTLAEGTIVTVSGYLLY